MPKYAQYNPTANPSPIYDWYDTDAGEWPNLPSKDQLLEINAAQWSVRNNGTWQVSNQQIVPVPSMSLVAAQAAQSALIEAAFHSAKGADIAYMSTMFQGDRQSGDVLIESLLNLNAKGATPSGFAWWDSYNNAVPMNLAQLQGLADALWQRGLSYFVHKRTQKNAIMTATTVASVQSIIW